MKNKLRLFFSLLIAAFGSNPLRRDFWRRLRKAVKLWVGGLKAGGKVSEEVYQARIQQGCRQCPIAFQRFGLLTCGSPLVKELRDKGCWCDMLTKARYAEADCWLDENSDLDFGWRRVFGNDRQIAPNSAQDRNKPTG